MSVDLHERLRNQADQVPSANPASLEQVMARGRQRRRHRVATIATTTMFVIVGLFVVIPGPSRVVVDPVTPGALFGPVHATIGIDDADDPAVRILREHPQTTVLSVTPSRPLPTRDSGTATSEMPDNLRIVGEVLFEIGPTDAPDALLLELLDHETIHHISLGSATAGPAPTAGVRRQPPADPGEVRTLDVPVAGTETTSRQLQLWTATSGSLCQRFTAPTDVGRDERGSCSPVVISDGLIPVGRIENFWDREGVMCRTVMHGPEVASIDIEIPTPELTPATVTTPVLPTLSAFQLAASCWKGDAPRAVIARDDSGNEIDRTPDSVPTSPQ